MGSSAGSIKAIQRTHRHISESTNQDARQLALSDATSFTLVTADMQTAGRGRQGRQWVSPAGNLYASLMIRPEKQWPDIGHFGHLTALALYDTIAALLPRSRVTLKWPNDVLVEGQKISGILIETGNMRLENDKVTADFVIIGMGVNVLTHPVEEVVYPVTSLAAHQPVEALDKEQVLALLMDNFQLRFQRWVGVGFTALKADYLRVADRLGEQITLRNGNVRHTGIYETIEDDGALVLRQADNSLITISAGDVLQPVDQVL